ncbi:MAG: tetratricopeptide repeat protein, partial [Sphingomicrobium sp.]
MIVEILVAASAAVANPTDSRLLEASHAITSGRLDQARTMIGNAIAAGAGGPPVERMLADLAFASGQNVEALTRYERLIAANPADLLLAERAGIAALK